MRHGFKFPSLAFVTRAVSAPVISDPGTLWANRVVANGGASPSAGTKSALTTFYRYLVNNGLFYKIVACNCVVPDNLVAALTPFIVGPGLDPWTNHNFASGDIGVDGLQGADTKYLETGINPKTSLLTASAGVTIYFHTSPNESKIDFGCTDGTTNYEYYNRYSNTAYWDCWNVTNDQGRIYIAQADGAGYISANRKAANHSALFRATSVVAHYAMKTITGTTIGTPPSLPAFLFTTNASGSPSVNYSTKQISFCAMHSGLTEAESLLFFVGVQSLRKALGGGWV